MPRLTLYNAPQSTCSQRVRYALNAKGLQFEEIRLDLFSGDQLKPEYLALNPNGVVPTLRVGEDVIIDSAVILEYLEDALPGLVFFRPESATEIATIRAMLRFIDEVPAPAIRIPSYNLAFLPHFQSMSQEEFKALCDSKPLRREFLLRMGRTGFPQTDLDEALGRLRRGIERVAAWIEASGGPWVAGPQMSIADIAMMPVIVRMADINLDYLWDDHVVIGKWLDAFRSTPAFTATFYYGSLLTEKYPHLAERRAERTRSREE